MEEPFSESASDQGEVFYSFSTAQAFGSPSSRAWIYARGRSTAQTGGASTSTADIYAEGSSAEAHLAPFIDLTQGEDEEIVATGRSNASAHSNEKYQYDNSIALGDVNIRSILNAGLFKAAKKKLCPRVRSAGKEMVAELFRDDQPALTTASSSIDAMSAHRVAAALSKRAERNYRQLFDTGFPSLFFCCS